MVVGDHINVHREFYWHHGIDVGLGNVVSWSPEGVLLQSLAGFCEGRQVHRVAYKPGKVPYTPEQVALRAVLAYALGMDLPYNLLLFNCEHFAIWCCTGVRLSRQVADAGRGMMATGILAAFFPPVALAGLAAAATGTVLPGAGELIWGTAAYVPS